MGGCIQGCGFRQNLESDFTIETRIERHPDDAHAGGADSVRNPVVEDGFGEHPGNLFGKYNANDYTLYAAS